MGEFKFYRIGKEWHARSVICGAPAECADEVTDDPNRVQQSFEEGANTLCDACQAEICWQYMLAGEAS